MSRTGKPCSSGNGSPFMPTASRASRVSVNASRGVPAVQPSLLRDSTMSAPLCGPAMASSSRTGQPSHSALPMRSPPTSLETQAMVMWRSVMGFESSVAKSSSMSRSTIPVTLRTQVSGSTAGTVRAVSIR
ncbi:hypothetical protein D9M72_461700 [compost metagenome]